MIPIVLIYLKESLDRRRRIAEWFEKKYVEETIDVLVDFFGQWAMLSALPARNPQELLANQVVTQVPSQSAGRLATMTGGVAFQNCFSAMRALWLQALNRGDWNKMVKFHQYSALIGEHLSLLRHGLLNHSLRSKGDAYSLRDLKCVKDFNEALERITVELSNEPDVTVYRAKDHTTETAS